MNSLIKIGNQELSVKEFKGQRIITFKDIDFVHERPDGTAGRNFRENKEKFIEGEDYFSLSSENLKDFKQATNFVGSNAKEIILITEQGYLMLVKSFQDDLAWTVQRQLVNTYFKTKSILDGLSPELQAIFSHDKKLQFIAEHIDSQDKKIVDVNDDLQTFKKDMPLLGIEESKITAAVRKKGVYCLGGKDSEAYQDRSLRGQVYSDIYGQLKREFGVDTYKAIKRSQCEHAIGIINCYELPMVLEEEIANTNAQMYMDA